MKDLFEKSAADDIVRRITKLQSTDVPQWGKMNVAQMLSHVQVPIEVSFGDVKLKRNMMGFLFGKFIKKKLFNDEPFSHGLPTAKEFVRADQRDFEQEKEKLLILIDRFVNGGPGGLTSEPHPFFGKLTPAEWSKFQWKHLNHHLVQFGV